MKHSIIDYILHNDETHDEVRESKEYRRVSDKRFEIYEALSESLTDEQKKMFEEFENLGTDEECMRCDEYFKLGLKIGVRFVAESMFD